MTNSTVIQDYATLDEAALVSLAVSSNDQRAFAELVNRHQSNLRYSLRQLTGWNESLADDLAQDSFIQAFKQLSNFRQQSKFSSWLYRIGYNTFLQHVRKKTLDVQSLDDNPLLEAHIEQSSGFDDDSQLEKSQLEKSELHTKVATLLAAIEPERRSVLHLLLHRQNTQSEIAEIMGIPLGTVKTHINRGRLALQQGLQDWRD